MADKQQNNCSGQLLIESAIALTVLILALTGLFALSNQALGLTRVIAERYVAANLAGEGIELIKSVVEKNILNSRPWGDNLEDTLSNPDWYYEMDFNDLLPSKQGGLATFLKFNKSSGLYWYDFSPDNVDTRFVRIIEVGFKDSENPNDIMIIHSIVRWSSRGGVQEEAKVEAEYFYWQQF